jgi:hypothetical protein
MVMKMAKTSLFVSGLAAMTLLSACVEGYTFEGTQKYHQGSDEVIATAYDYGRDSGVLDNGHAAIAYDPDGCQAWLIDDGLEGYAGRRFDPVSGLPVCNNKYAPGTVVGNYQSQSPGLVDRVPSAPNRHRN